jgi:transposase
MYKVGHRDTVKPRHVTIAGSAEMSKRWWIGVDVSKQSFTAALASEQDKPSDWVHMAYRSFANTATGLNGFVQWARERLDGSELEGICLESTGRLGWTWMETLGQRLGPVSVVNPARPKRFAESLGLRDKMDRLDACVLASFGVMVRPMPTTLPEPVLRELRECNRIFTAISVDRQAYEKRLRDGFSSAVVRRELRKTVAGLERRMDALQKRMDELVASAPGLAEDVERITTIKGVGRRTAYVLIAELGDIRTYSRSELVSFAGLYPRAVQSGSSVHKPSRLAKRGGGPIRRALYLCAMSARVHNPQMRRFYLRLRENGKAPMAALGAVMRKLLLLARSLLIHGTLYDPSHT